MKRKKYGIRLSDETIAELVPEVDRRSTAAGVVLTTAAVIEALVRERLAALRVSL